MAPASREVDRFLTLLRNKIREQGFTQLEVQSELGWGKSYISQLLTRQKSLRVEQVLLILRVIGVEPEAFFAELYPAAFRASRFTAQLSPLLPQHEYGQLRQLLRALVDLLLDKGLVNIEELSSPR